MSKDDMCLQEHMWPEVIARFDLLRIPVTVLNVNGYPAEIIVRKPCKEKSESFCHIQPNGRITERDWYRLEMLFPIPVKFDLSSIEPQLCDIESSIRTLQSEFNSLSDGDTVQEVKNIVNNIQGIAWDLSRMCTELSFELK